MLFPSGRWFTAEIESLRRRNGLTYVELPERVAQFEADPAAIMPLLAAGMRKSSGDPNVRAVIRTGDGLTWDQVRIEVGASRTVHFKTTAQSGKYVFPPNSELQPENQRERRSSLDELVHWGGDHKERLSPDRSSPFKM